MLAGLAGAGKVSPSRTYTTITHKVLGECPMQTPNMPGVLQLWQSSGSRQCLSLGIPALGSIALAPPRGLQRVQNYTETKEGFSNTAHKLSETGKSALSPGNALDTAQWKFLLAPGSCWAVKGSQKANTALGTGTSKSKLQETQPGWPCCPSGHRELQGGTKSSVLTHG